MHNPKDIGEKVRIGREGLELTQRQVAARAGVSLSTVKRVESGGCDAVSFGNVASVLNAVGFDVHVDRGVMSSAAWDEQADIDVEALLSEKYGFAEDSPKATKAEGRNESA